MKVKQLDQFEVYRSLMFSIAYRMLGSAMDAEDIVQEAFLRYRKVDPNSIRSQKAFLATIVTRLSINALQTARMQREVYIGPWLPEPLRAGEGKFPSPASQVVLDESISMAFMILLESLDPVERAVFLLREIFDYEYAEIAKIVGKQETNCRQLFSRAKKHIREHRSRFKSTPREHRQLLKHFLRAAAQGDLEGLLQIISDDVTTWVDSGSKVHGAAIHPVHGSQRVAKQVIASLSQIKNLMDVHTEIEMVNGKPALVARAGDDPLAVISAGIRHGKIHELWIIGNPDKLTHI